MELTLTIEEWELLSEILGERHRVLLREIHIRTIANSSFYCLRGRSFSSLL